MPGRRQGLPESHYYFKRPRVYVCIASGVRFMKTNSKISLYSLAAYAFYFLTEPLTGAIYWSFIAININNANQVLTRYCSSFGFKN